MIALNYWGMYGKNAYTYVVCYKRNIEVNQMAPRIMAHNGAYINGNGWLP